MKKDNENRAVPGANGEKFSQLSAQPLIIFTDCFIIEEWRELRRKQYPEE